MAAKPTTAVATVVPTRPWILAPSDFAFLYDECQHCFWEKVVAGRPRPRTPFPKVFTTIDKAMKDRFLGERSTTLSSRLPAGSIGASRWVRSQPIELPGVSRPIVINGQLDTTIDCDDGRLAILDFKTTEPKATHVATYGRQLHGYALAGEHPSSDRAVEVAALGLACFEPDWFHSDGNTAMLCGAVEVIEVPLDRDGFQAFLTEVGVLLGHPTAPPPSSSCVWCQWRERGEAA
jgi:hypothetical protein